MDHVSFARQSRPLTEIEFCSWVAQALPGDRLEYHEGFLALDRRRSDIDRLARRAFWAFEQRLVHLVQERIGAERYLYIAIGRCKPCTGPASVRLANGDAQ